MAKTKISEFSATANSNTDINSINIAEGCAPSNINDAIRELMAELKDFQAGTKGDSFNGPVGTSTAAAGAFTTLSSTGNTTLGDASGDTVTINGTATFANVNPTLSAGTANGVLYLNGSKVATSGSALTFDGSLLSNTGRIKTATGSTGGSFDLGYASDSGSRSYRIQNDFGVFGDFVIAQSTTQTGTTYNALYSALNSGVQYWSVGGSEQMRLTSTGLGIGTSSPVQKLTVQGVISTKNSSGTDIVQIGDIGSTLRIQGRTSIPMTFWVEDAERMRLDSSGNLGLGVTPNTWAGTGVKAFQFQNGALAASSSFGTMLSWNAYYDGSYKYTASTTAGMYQVGGTHAWYTAASGTAGNTITFTQAMTLDASGNLVVGGTSALVSTSGRGNITINGSSESILAFGIGGTNSGYIYSTASALTINAQPSRTINFEAGGTERARIDSSGNLLINKTTATTTGAGGYILASGQVSGTRDGGAAGAFRRDTSDGDVVIFLRGGTQVGSVSVTTTATAYNTSSDYRLKENIQPMTGALAKVQALKPCTYNWKADGSDGEGFIAHELAEIVPQAVTGQKDAVDADGNPVYQGIDTSFLVATLTAAIQELNAKVQALEAQLNKGA